MHTIELALTWFVNNLPGILSAVGAYMAWRKSQQNASAIDVVHQTINSNHEKDMARATESGRNAGIVSERAAADARAVEVRKFDEHV